MTKVGATGVHALRSMREQGVSTNMAASWYNRRLRSQTENNFVSVAICLGSNHNLIGLCRMFGTYHMESENSGPEVTWTGSHVDRKSRGPEVTWTGSHLDRKSRGSEVTWT